MKFTCGREELIKNLNIAQRATDPKSNVAVLRNVLFELKDGKLNLAGYDHRIGIRTSVNCEIEEEGAAAVPCSLLLEVLGVMSDPRVSFAMSEGVLTMECGKARYNFNCIDADDFPPFPKTSGGKSFEIEPALFEKAVRQTIFATNQDDPRPFMGGVFMAVRGGELVFVATDGHRLTLRKFPDFAPPLEDKGVIIPTRTLNELLRVISAVPSPKPEKGGDKEGDAEKPKPPVLTITAQDESISFELDSIYVISRLVKAEFPNYEKVLPAASLGSARVSRTRLMSAVRGVAIMARAKENQNIIELNIADNLMRLHAATQDVGSADEELDIDKKGNDIRVSFNSRYVINFLEVVDDEEITVDYTEELKATMFHTDSPDYKYVLMPIKM